MKTKEFRGTFDQVSAEVRRHANDGWKLKSFGWLREVNGTAIAVMEFDSDKKVSKKRK